MSKRANRKPNRKYKVPQHERIARSRRRFQAQKRARELKEDEERRLQEELKVA